MTAAAVRQLRLLNTNSRFHYGSVAWFAERLAALLPEPLDSVFLVSTGSEAVDFALRLARAKTGRGDLLCVRDAYHGWTTATLAVSTTRSTIPRRRDAAAVGAHRPLAQRLSRPVAHGVPGAGPVTPTRRRSRSASSEPRAGRRRRSSARRSTATPAASPCRTATWTPCTRRARGRRRLHRRRGAGRVRPARRVVLGFQQQRVVPDIVTVAKSTGNGYPLGAVITSRARSPMRSRRRLLLLLHRRQPSRARSGITVLDVLRDEGLQENARVVGGALRSGAARADRLPSTRSQAPCTAWAST